MRTSAASPGSERSLTRSSSPLARRPRTRSMAKMASSSSTSIVYKGRSSKMEVLASYPQHHRLRGSFSTDLTPRCLFRGDSTEACDSKQTSAVQENTSFMPQGDVTSTAIEDLSVNGRSEGEYLQSEIKEEKDSDADEAHLQPNKRSSSQKEHNQIAYLMNCLPALGSFFELHRKIGEGTFSSVFLATLKNVPNGSPLANRQFAVKHLIPTTHPSRAERELRCLQEIGGRDNVVGVHLCLRNLDNIAFIMPYLPHRRFSEYVIDMGVPETRNYMKHLLLALRRVHSFNIIHRDVKPSNFLYDRETKQFLLVDFGLSQSVEETSKSSSSSPILKSNFRKRKRETDCNDPLKSTPSADFNENVAKRPALAPRNFIDIPKTPEKSVKVSSGSDIGVPTVSSNRAKSLQNITNVNGHGIISQKPASMSLGLKRLIMSPSKESTDNGHLKKTPRKNKHPANNENILSPPKLEYRGGLRKGGFGANEIYQDGSSPTSASKCALDLRKVKPDVDEKQTGILQRPGVSSSLQRKILFDDFPDDKNKVEDSNSTPSSSLLSAKYQQFSRRSLNQLSRNSPGTPLPVSGVYPQSGESESFASPFRSPDQSASSSKEFRTLGPERGRDIAPGSSLIRVQNSQVKSQQLSPITPSETRKLKVKPVQQRPDKGNDVGSQNIIFAKPQAPSANGSVHRTSTPSSPRCNCYGRPQICAVCMSRKANNAPRAGTPGFRPPEVLLRSPLQSTAVDMWAVGVILLCILSGCYPFFHSPDDLTALAEIMTVFGTDKIKETAARLGRMVVCSQPNGPLDLKKLCTRMRLRRKVQRSSTASSKGASDEKCKNCFQRLGIPDSCICLEDQKDALLINPLDVNNVEESEDVFPDSAYHLLARLLDLNADTRITAAQALEHPFVCV